MITNPHLMHADGKQLAICRRKLAYVSKKTAKQAIGKMGAENHLRAYICIYCRKFHVTSN